ncbi:hypothetical protein HYDPIDRAFT_168142 [Hydnomerulius pinastri MD-312]|uniref:Uncharacterized protein n=1 Tax=Hydnomerulius pinastri MD-312 TaxID=994086 RepID=A0A0C9W8W1_9AGAM|nr:hypothetical protein HYDPIDRAFT_168142 [Hydnomerulius pinastri MD-312]
MSMSSLTMCFPFVCSIPCQDPSTVDLDDSEVASTASSITSSYFSSNLSSESIASRPAASEQPWPYRFYSGERAWARGGNGEWRLVLLLDDGSLEDHDGRDVPVYTATWTGIDGFVARGAFSPLLGNLKPDTETVRHLLREEKAPVQGDADKLYLETVDLGT